MTQVLQGWRRARLGDCCEIVSGATPRTDRAEYWNGDIQWATPRDLSDLETPVLYETAQRITREGYSSCSTSLLPAGAVLFTSRAPVGLVAIAGAPMCTNQGFKSLVPGPDVDSRYLYWCLRQFAVAIEGRGNGTTFTEVSKVVVSRFEIPLPPLSEQRRIASTLETVDSIRRERRVSLELLDGFLHSAFLDMFGDPVNNKKGWPSIDAASAIRLVEAGTSIKGEAKVPDDTQWAVLKISAVTSGWYLPSECKTVAAPPDRPVVPRRGDLLFSRANTRELVAATCLVDHDAERLFLPDKLWRITPNTAVATPEYLRFLFANSRFRRTLTRHATGTSGSMLNVSQEKVLKLQLPMPPLVLQHRFAAVVWKAFQMRDRIHDTIRHADAMFDSLAQRAFA